MSARILVSRNKREGGYCGTSDGFHWRAGVGAMWTDPRSTLRELSRL